MAEYEVLTADEGTRIGWAASFMGMAHGELLRAVCQVKSALSSKPQLLGSVRAQLAGDWEDDSKSAKALLLMIKSAMAGATIYFSVGLGGALASALAAFGIVVAAELITVVLVVVAVIVLFASLPKIPKALAAMKNIDIDAP